MTSNLKPFEDHLKHREGVNPDLPAFSVPEEFASKAGRVCSEFWLP